MSRTLQLVALSLLLLAAIPAMPMSEHTETVMRGDWPSYENGSSILSLPQVRAILEKFEEDDGIRVELRYPGGDAGRMWAESLQQWFVTFGIPASYLELMPGSGAANQLVIALIDRR